ncbi:MULTISPECIES: helix-turn-helix domain-containing protein [Leptolyngbya]|jgi:DNA-binding transcriptional MerR regulator|nr:MULTISPECIES: MerR family transcriptional regulator [Leptolyngbya]MBD2402012.1 MerR family transcriptional regulator [Leptolyngbya sp. FACHB-239]MBD2371091.1 MerR family transcriptional regulator [Leptolyngbya sp. FACHB-161]MBD2377559.1 MerR family transcriptional regulator [Leptolyngbya sp. FACHB-238]MBD2408531.1 MerR family transcriptional regulator [Leptolyngbya sp. FACHB-402]BAS60431.1 hypothetical protein LBWT_Y0190 [Leptolyngbya boryana IAM M-101]
MTTGFNRQEVIAMTGIKPSNLSYLDETDLVKPHKIGESKKPQVIYSIEQVIQIKLIQRLREQLSLQEIRKIFQFLVDRQYQPSIFGCKLMRVGKELYFVESECEFGAYVLSVSGKHKGQIMIHQIGELGEAIVELQQEALKRQILDYEKRAKGTLLETVSQVMAKK